MVYLGMKRGREGEVSTIVSIANCLMLLSDSIKSNPPSRLFECKTCNRQFSSFQALGGHRASHKKQRLVESETIQCSPPKPKTHECPICGLEFMVGQALGGHMRRHRVAASEGYESTFAASEGYESTELTLFPSRVPPKEENSGEFVCLDLNLTPSENESDFHLNKVAPKVLCFL